MRSAPDSGLPADTEDYVGPQDPEDVVDEEDLDEGDAAGEADADEGEGDADAAEGQEGQGDVDRRSSRPGRAERARSNLRRVSEELELTKREIAELRNQQQRPPVDPAAAQRAETEFWERMSMLDPVQMAREVQHRSAVQMQQYMAVQQRDMADRLDRQAFESTARADPVRANYTQRVEQELQRQRQLGGNPDREQLYFLLLGRDVAQQGARGAGAQRRAGQSRVARQATRPGGGRSDVPRSRGRSSQDDADEALLRGTNPNDL